MILDSIFAAVTETSVSDLLNPKKWLLEWAQGFGSVNEDAANTIPSFWAAVGNLSEDVAKLPLILYERLPEREGGLPGGRRRARDHPLHSLLSFRTSESSTSFTFRESLTADALVHGNGIALIERDGQDRPTGLVWTPPESLQDITKEDGRLTYDIAVELDGRVEVLPFDQAEVFHLRGKGSGHSGKSVVRYHAESLGVAIETQKVAGALFKNGIRPSGILTYTKRLNETGQENVRKAITKANSSADDKLKLVLLEEGFDFKQLTIPPEEAQFLETRAFQVTDVARIFRMPPHKIGHLENATFSNIEQQSIEYVVDTLTPWLCRWECEIAAKLVAESERERYFAEFLTAGLLRGDSAARSAFYREMVGIGALSPNEVRELENLGNPVEGGDTHHFPMNMQAIEEEEEDQVEDDAQDGDEDEAPVPPGREDEDEDDEEEDEESAMAEGTEGIVLFPLVLDVFQRAAAREGKALARAIKRGGDLDDWAENFYQGHALYLKRTIGPILATLDRLELEVPDGVETKHLEGRVLSISGYGIAQAAILAEQVDSEAEALAHEFISKIRRKAT